MPQQKRPNSGSRSRRPVQGVHAHGAPSSVSPPSIQPTLGPARARMVRASRPWSSCCPDTTRRPGRWYPESAWGGAGQVSQALL